MNNTYTNELEAEKAVNRSLLREIARLNKEKEGTISMSRKVIVFEHEGELYATTNYEPVDEVKLSDFVKDISNSLEEATSALENYRALAEKFPPKQPEEVAPAEPVAAEGEATQPVADQPAPAEAPATPEAQTAETQPAPAPAEAPAEPSILSTGPAPETPPAEATSAQTVHIQ